jgi:hypothetical protein
VESAGITTTHDKVLSAIATMTSSLGSPLHEKPLFWRALSTVPHSARSESTVITARVT